MAHPLHHAESSARKFGGRAEDYQHIHDWFDASKAHLALPAHRAMRHHTLGIFDAEQRFGLSMTNSAGRTIPTRWIGEQHIREDCRYIPTVQDWLKHLHIEPWMVMPAPRHQEDADIDPAAAWRKAVASQQTTLGLAEWMENREALAG
jgi:hypothetical protein